MQKFVYDMFDEITPPVIVLSTKYHKHLGTIQNAINIACDFNMASHQEISFDVYKTLDDIACDLWDDIVDLKYIYVPDHNEYYEIQVTMDDADSTVKHCVGISAGECELSQRYLRDFHCNDDTDINFEPIYKVKNGQAVKVNANGVVDFAYDMYETDKLEGQDELYKATVFYRKVNSTDSTALKKKKRRSSLLYRVLHDKCPDWSVGHIDSTLANIQRTFSTDATTVYDFLTNTIATEIGCLFKFDSVNRKINVYDLKNTCEDCGFRGEYVDECPKCGSKKFIRGYGAYKNVNISTDNTALQMSVDGDADSVKNCFRITGGDDLMTATVRNINPNKSSYIYRFSDDMKADMPEELVEKLNAYETDYNNKIQEYNNKTKLWMEKVDEVLRLQTTMMPKTPIPDETNAKAQVDAIMAIERIDVALEKIDASSTPTQSMADNAVKGYLRVIVDPRYTVDVSGGTMSNTRRSWQGYITVKSLGGVDENGNEDIYTSTTKKTVHFNTNYEDFLEQKIQKSLDRTDASFTTIFNIEDDTAFKEALHLYSLDRLNSFANSYQAILEVLIKQGVTKEYTELYGADLYNQMYVPYYNRKQWINNEITGNNGGEGRENQVKQAEEERDALDKQRQAIQKELDIETYLGDLYNTFLLYLREDNYNNSNYISDGLNNKELVDRANELFIAAQSDLIKASELQYSLTGNLFNFLNTEEFADFKDEFEIGDYIICKADNKIYRLRITNVSYSYDNSAEIQITFSNIVRGGNFMSDVASVLSKASSMATSFNFVAHQANQGDNANNVINDYKNNGFDTDVYNLYAGSNQDISMDSHGLTAREYDDIEGDYKQEQVILTSHSLAFTEDNWETASLGLGRQTYTYWDEDNNQWVTAVGYGLNAKFVDAGYIRGSKIVAGDIYSNNYTANGATGAHIDLDEGTFTFADGKLKFDGTNLYVQADVDIGSRIEDATIVDSTINTNNNFIVDQYGDVVINGNVSGTAWATKQDKLGINPAGSATATIYKLQIDGDIYDLAGGSTVIPNPTGTATATLTKLGIDDVVYEIQGGSEYLELTQAEYDALTPEQKMNGTIYFITDAEGGGDACYQELTRDEYEALPESDKNNNTIYFVQDTFEVEIPPEGMLLGDYMRIQNSKLNPNYHWDTDGEQIKFFFNSNDCEYCYNTYKGRRYDGNAGMHPYYDHGISYVGDSRNVLITQDMPVDTHYVGVYQSIYGLQCTSLIFIPKDIIDNGQAAMFSQFFYTSVECELKSCHVWNDWSDPANYSQVVTTTLQPGSYDLNNGNFIQYGFLTNSWFANYPIIGGNYIGTTYITQEEIDTYLATKEDNYPRYFNVNYFTYDHVMLPNIIGTEYFNSIDYTGRIEVVANPSGTATADLNKIKIDGVVYDIPNGATAADTTYDNTDSGLTATNVQDAIDEISVIEGLSDVNITTPSDGDALIYDATNQEWVNGSAGGGTTVVPNPQGVPTDTLTTIQIGNDIYEIEGNGNEELIYSLQQGARWETFPNPNSNQPLIVKAYGGNNTTVEVEVDVNDLPSRDGGDYYTTVCILPNAQGQSVNMATANDGATICVSTDNAFDTSTMGVNVYKRGSGGSSIIPNPQGTPTDTLNTVEIDGVIYDIEGGGTNVEANPQDSPTDTLSTIKIGDTVYDIAGTGGDGFGGGCKVDTLYQAANSGGASLNTPITYNNGKHLSDYDLCYVYLTVTASGDATLFESHSFCPKDQPRPVFRVTGYGNRFTNVEMTDTDFTVTAETGESWDYTYKVYTILGIKFGSNQSSSDSSEIIPIEAGNNTTTRTFTFAKQPQFIKFYWGDPVISGGWATDAELVWGQAYMNYRSKPMGATTSQVDGGIASIAYGADGKSITLTGANAFGAMNTSNGSGYMFVDYGGSIVTTAYEDIAEGEWTSLLVHTPVSGGSWSAATAIPTDATHIAMMVNYRSTNYEPMILRLADLDKMAEATGNSNVKGGYQWQVGSDYDKVAYDYDSVNKTISVYAGYNGLSVNVFSIKADTPSQDRNAESRTDTIWSGSETTSAWVSPIILDDLPLDDYDMLSVQINDTQQLVMVNQIPTGDSDGNINIGLGGFLRNNDATATLQIFLNRVGNTLRMFTGTGNSANLTKIAGIKFANAKANPMCYAEVEREVGTWTDGKPLYQRTFDLSNTTFSDNAWTNNVLGTSGINIKKFEGYFSLVGYDSRFPLDYYRSSGEYFTSMTNNDCTDLSFRPNMNAGVGVRGDIVTIWYTKNSDVAGSGMYTSTGTPTVHYSTVEHVVGTWIDGKPIYERSYTNFSSLTGANRTLNFGLSGIENIWYVSEACVISNGSYPFPYVHWDTNSNAIGGFFDLNSGSPLFEFRTGSQSTGAVINVFTIRYTKSTT